MTFPAPNSPADLRCPVRKKVISSMVCHTCANHIKVLYKSENPPELQCSCWDWSVDEVERETE